MERDPPRTGLKLVERLISNTLHEDGLSAWYRHGIALESALPVEMLEKLPGEQWEKFRLLRWPQLKQQLVAKRERYAGNYPAI